MLLLNNEFIGSAFCHVLLAYRVDWAKERGKKFPAALSKKKSRKREKVSERKTIKAVTRMCAYVRTELPQETLISQDAKEKNYRRRNLWRKAFSARFTARKIAQRQPACSCGKKSPESPFAAVVHRQMNTL